MEKTSNLWKALDWLAELPRTDEFGDVWRPAERMGFVEYGIKLLVGAVMVLFAGLLVVLVGLLPVVAVAVFLACCPAVALAVAGAAAFAVGLGWLRKRFQKDAEVDSCQKT